MEVEVHLSLHIYKGRAQVLKQLAGGSEVRTICLDFPVEPLDH